MRFRDLRSVFITLIVASAPEAASANVNNDQVLSQHIKEADGRSGQDTNSGSGVKTGHIQDGAITGPKIAPGAVTDAQITGPISGSKLGSHSHGVNDVVGLATALDGKANRYANVIVVAKSGGDFTSPLDAVNSITDASSTNPYLVKIMPGVYEIPPASFINVPAYVDIEGSGPGVTKITGVTVGSPLGTLRYMRGPAQLRDITVEQYANIPVCDGGSYMTVAVQVVGPAGAPTLVNTRVVAFGGNSMTALLSEFGGSAVLRDTDVEALAPGCNGNATALSATGGGSILASGGQIRSDGWAVNVGSATVAEFRDVKVVASPTTNAAIGVTGTSAVTLYGGKIEAWAPFAGYPNTIKAAHTQIVSNATWYPADWGRFFGCYDGNLNPL